MVLKATAYASEPSGGLSDVALDFAHAETGISRFLLALLWLLFDILSFVLASCFPLLSSLGWHGKWRSELDLFNSGGHQVKNKICLYSLKIVRVNSKQPRNHAAQTLELLYDSVRIITSASDLRIYIADQVCS